MGPDIEIIPVATIEDIKNYSSLKRLPVTKDLILSFLDDSGYIISVNYTKAKNWDFTITTPFQTAESTIAVTSRLKAYDLAIMETVKLYEEGFHLKLITEAIN